MNCQELHSVLDVHRQEDLSPAQRLDIESHFASCETCRETWAVYRELCAAPIAETPKDLRRRIAAAIDAKASHDVRRVRRSIILGGVLVVGAAMAKTLSLGVEQRERMCTRS